MAARYRSFDRSVCARLESFSYLVSAAIYSSNAKVKSFGYGSRREPLIDAGAGERSTGHFRISQGNTGLSAVAN